MSTPEPFNWIRLYCRLIEKTEIPPRFAIWTGIATLLSTLETRVFINQGIYVVRPNFFIVLVAGSGAKKSTAISITSRLIGKMKNKPRVISQKITPEALIGALKEIQQAESKPSGPGRVVKSKSGGIIIADELSTFLDKHALERGLGPMLTTLFDCGPFEYTTIGRGVERLENSYLSILGGTTVELLRNSLPKDAIGGGFTSRTIFVYEDRRPPPIPWVEADPEHERIMNTLVTYLDRLMLLEGAIEVTSEARAVYERIYINRYENVGKQVGLAQYENRRHTHLLKVAIALMVCEEPSLVLKEQHILGADTILEEAEEHLPRVMELLLASETGHSNTLVLSYIKSRPEGLCYRYDLVRRFSSQYNAMEISGIIDTLVTAREIKIDNIEGRLVYKVLRNEN